MYPFDLPGPEFLLFYAVLGAIVLVAVRLRLRSWEKVVTPQTSLRQIDLSDPYLIAYLRGYKDEALRVAILSLIDRGLLRIQEPKSGTLVRAGSAEVAGTSTRSSEDVVRRRIEKWILNAFAEPRPLNERLPFLRESECFGEFDQTLTGAGLMPDEYSRAYRRRLKTKAWVFLGAVAGIKILVGLSRNRPVTFLVLEALIFASLIEAVGTPRLTAKGLATLQDLKHLFGSARKRASVLRPGATSNELALLAGVFGLAAVPIGMFPVAGFLVPKDKSGATWWDSVGSGGTSCGGSSCGGGCGGGCGGCGG